MRIKTIIIILVTILLTTVLMQNRGEVRFTILFGDFYISKLIMLTLVAVVAFVLGWLVGRPKSIKRLGGDFPGSQADKDHPGTLSDEDKEYIE